MEEQFYEDKGKIMKKQLLVLALSLLSAVALRCDVDDTVYVPAKNADEMGIGSTMEPGIVMNLERTHEPGEAAPTFSRTTPLSGPAYNDLMPVEAEKTQANEPTPGLTEAEKDKRMERQSGKKKHAKGGKREKATRKRRGQNEQEVGKVGTGIK
jgi:hypothetical protein